jgi:hypothetical protein
MEASTSETHPCAIMFRWVQVCNCEQTLKFGSVSVGRFASPSRLPDSMLGHLSQVKMESAVNSAQQRTGHMKRIAILALMLNLGVAGVYAQQKKSVPVNVPVKMTFSGTLAPTTINLLQPNTNTDEQNLDGFGTLGPFTFRELHADPASPSSQPPSTCSGPTHLYFPNVAGGGVFRFQDASLLTVGVTAGSSICIDFAAGMAHLTTNYQITGGTGRFKGASGALTLTATLMPVLFTASGGVPLTTDTGEFEGTVSGVAIGEDGQDERQ